jgi:ketosteroid isomerase-like protein
MLKKLFLFISLMCALAAAGLAQNTNSSATTTTTTKTTRARTSTKTTTPKPSNIEEQGTQEETSNQNAARTRRPRTTQTATKDPGAKGVLAAFEELLNGIRNADIEAVTGAYWNSPQLILFNNNGTVTKGWEQMRKNRESSYPELKDVKLDVRDVRVQMLGRDGAIVTCLWTQSQTFRGASETATGRMTLAFRRVGNTWKAIHLHTSPDAPDPSRLLPSEQTPTPAPKTPATKTRP